MPFFQQIEDKILDGSSLHKYFGSIPHISQDQVVLPGPFAEGEDDSEESICEKFSEDVLNDSSALD